MLKTNKIFYLEFQSRDLAGSKRFFEQVFGWKFTDYGPDYASFNEGDDVSGGFYRSDKPGTVAAGAPLTVLLNQDLDKTLDQVTAAGGTITKSIFPFPGGRRFHFTEPGGNELAVCALDQPT